MEKSWFIFQSDHHLGPFTTVEVFEMLESGRIDDEVPLWKEGVDDWRPLKEFPEFSSLYEEEIVPEVNELPDLPEVPSFEDIPFEEPIDLPDLPEEETPDIETHEEAVELPELPSVPTKVWEEVLSEFIEEVEEKEVVSDFQDESHLHLEELINIPNIKSVEHPKEDFKVNPDLVSSEETAENVWSEIESDPSNKKVNYKLVTAVASCFIILVLSGYLIFQSAKSYVNLEDFSSITIERVDEIRSSSFSGDVRAEVFMSKNSKELMLATNIRHKSKVYLTLSSVTNKTISKNKIVATAMGIVINGVAKFPEIKIVKGDSFASGEYYVQMLAIPVGVEQRAYSYLYSKFEFSFFRPKEQLRFRGKSLIFPGTKEDFEKSITEYKEQTKKAEEKPLKYLIEIYKTFSTLSTKIYKTYEDVLTSIRRGRDIESFEILYSKDLGPVLQGLILETHKKYKEYEISDPIMSKNFEVLLEQGKRIGEMASDMVTMTQKVKRLRKKNRDRLMKLFIKRSLFLQETSKTKVEEIQKVLSDSKL